MFFISLLAVISDSSGSFSLVNVVIILSSLMF